MPNKLEGFSGQSKRKKLGGISSWLLAGTTLLASIYNPVSVSARTIESIQPKFIDDDCSSKTIIPGERPTFEASNGVITARGYRFDETNRAGLVKLAFRNLEGPSGISTGSWNVDFVIMTMPLGPVDSEDTSRIRHALEARYNFVLDEIVDPYSISSRDKNYDSSDSYTATFTALVSGCSMGEILITDRNPNVTIDGVNVLESAASL